MSSIEDYAVRLTNCARENKHLNGGYNEDDDETNGG